MVKRLFVDELAVRAMSISLTLTMKEKLDLAAICKNVTPVIRDT